MKNTTFAAILLSFLILGAAPLPQYQVITADPHHLEVLTPHLQTVSQVGRLWLATIKPSMPANLMQHMRLVGSERVAHYRPNVRKSNRVDPAIQTLVSSVQVSRIRADIEALSNNYRTRRVGTDENRAAVTWVEQQLRAMGLVTRQICYRSGACSVIADKVGTAGSPDVVLIMAHIDSVGQTFAGADDNASGTAALLEMARVLTTVEHTHSLRFFVTNGEESNLLGAKHYADELSRSGEIRKISMAINMDMVGYNSTNLVELETNAPYDNLAREFAELAASYTALTTKITLGAWGSDHVPFLDKGVAAILTIENWDTKTPCYHAACDKPDTINYNYAAEITKLNVAAVASKAKD